MSYTPRLQEKYKAEIIPALTDKFGYKSVMQVPKLTKIVLSQGLGEAVADKKNAHLLVLLILFYDPKLKYSHP